MNTVSNANNCFLKIWEKQKANKQTTLPLLTYNALSLPPSTVPIDSMCWINTDTFLNNNYQNLLWNSENF